MYQTAHPTRRQWITVCAAILFTASFAGCDLTEPDDSCGGSDLDTFETSQAFAFPLPQTAQISGGQARFTWSLEVSGICSTGSHSNTTSAAHVYADPSVSPPSGLAMQTLVYHAAFAQPYGANVEFWKLDDDGVNHWRGIVENIGLKQGNPDGGPATIVTELVVSFNSSGNIDTDRVNASRFIKRLAIFTNYKLAK